MIRIKLNSTMGEYLQKIGPWLDKELHNPPLPEEQRWTLIGEEDATYIDFTEDHDATIFVLKWAQYA